MKDSGSSMTNLSKGIDKQNRAKKSMTIKEADSWQDLFSQE